MFAVLVVIFFLRDGTRHVQAQVEPTEAACTAQANKYANDFYGHLDPSILGVGFRCDVLDNPPVRKVQ